MALDPTAPGCAFLASAIIAFSWYTSEKEKIKKMDDTSVYYIVIVLGSAFIGGLIGWIFIRGFLTILGILPHSFGGEFDFFSNFVAGFVGGGVGMIAGAVVSE